MYDIIVPYGNISHPGDWKVFSDKHLTTNQHQTHPQDLARRNGLRARQGWSGLSHVGLGGSVGAQANYYQLVARFIFVRHFYIEVLVRIIGIPLVVTHKGKFGHALRFDHTDPLLNKVHLTPVARVGLDQEKILWRDLKVPNAEKRISWLHLNPVTCLPEKSTGGWQRFTTQQARAVGWSAQQRLAGNRKGPARGRGLRAVRKQRLASAAQQPRGVYLRMIANRRE